MNISIKKFQPGYRDAMIEIWEQSVRATHHFLELEDIDFYKTLVLGIDFTSFDCYCVFDQSDEMIGIMGIANKKLEMLFLKPSVIGTGVGRKLMEFILNELKVNKVDVNEGNTNAVNFYKKFGFQVYERTPLDDSGKPYPILRMKINAYSND